MHACVGYCTNVHAGANLDLTRANLARHAVSVKRKYSPQEPMRIGLWFSNEASAELEEETVVNELAAWLSGQGLVPYTLNGFPYCDFHQAVVKFRVYQPDWTQEERCRYTQRLATILARILPPGEEGSISTLPLAWGNPPPGEAALDRAAAWLRRVAAHMAKLEAETGHCIYLCIEPEPGCAIQYSTDVVRFFHRHLLPGTDEALLRRHIRVCHDVCHATVMREDQEDVLGRYQAAEILIGKVQISSAVQATVEAGSARAAPILEQLSRLAEDRYLHQSTVADSAGNGRFFEDLPEALAFLESCSSGTRDIRIHYHVPVYLQSFGDLEATRGEIERCIRALPRYSQCRHLEVETYAWNVLPAELQRAELADGIADELRWFNTLLARVQESP